LNLSDSRWKQFIKCLKLYPAMEEWFHDCIDKQEVQSSKNEIAKVLSLMQSFFPLCDKTNGYCIPKMHGITTMQEYIKLFGSGMNFYGGPGEADHRTFAKCAGQKTQRCVDEFAKQTANQYYNMMLTLHVVQSCINESSVLNNHLAKMMELLQSINKRQKMQL
jgi:hypothetical protein